MDPARYGRKFTQGKESTVMLDKKMMSDLISIVLHGGADFAEVYAEYSHNSMIAYANRKIESINDQIISGVVYNKRFFLFPRQV